LTEKDSQGATPLQVAIYSQWSEGIKLLIRRENVNIQNIYGNTALHLAVSYKLYDVVKPLLDAGAKVNIKNNNGNTALHSAIYKSLSYQMYDVVKLLLKNGAKINIKNNKEETPLYIAREYKYTRIIELLILHSFKNSNVRSHKVTSKSHDSSHPKERKPRRRTLRRKHSSK